MSVTYLLLLFVVIFENMSEGTRRLMEESTTTIESSNFLTSKEEFSNTSTKDLIGCAPSSDPTPSCSEYFSSRIQTIVESRSEFGINLETEIEVSKVHWSELQAVNGEEDSAEANLEVYRSLQNQWPNGFFWDLDDEAFVLDEKVAEGAQGEIFTLRFLIPELTHLNDTYVLKVLKKGSCLQDLQMQWPQGMLHKANISRSPCYMTQGSSEIMRGLMLKDGRFAFQMRRCWGDLRKVIDLRMVHNRMQAPPFPNVTTRRMMKQIAFGMRSLHRDNIIHRDLKASNVLIRPPIGGAFLDGFNPIRDDLFLCYIADFECSVGVVGTRFWRAPEILLGVKNHEVQPNLFTEKSDVYSYAMTCYEILTGHVPLESLRSNDYDAILQGARPMLPSGIEPSIQSLVCRCWHHDPSQRPSFEEIIDKFHS